jgi:hypothetical protein
MAEILGIMWVLDRLAPWLLRREVKRLGRLVVFCDDLLTIEGVA